LEDQCVISRQVTVAAGVFAPGHLGELTQIVPFEMVDAALAETASTLRRVRLLPARVTVYLLLAGCLFAEVGYRQVWHKLTAGLTGLVVADPSENALWQARARLGVAPVRWLFDLLRGPAATAAGTRVRWCGLLVCAIDGGGVRWSVYMILSEGVHRCPWHKISSRVRLGTRSTT